MTISKFLNDRADFVVNTGSVSLQPPYFDAKRVPGWELSRNDHFCADWPEEFSDDLWIHFTIGYDPRNMPTSLDSYLTFEDSHGHVLACSDIKDGYAIWTLVAAENSLDFKYKILTGAQLVMDIHFGRNRTTDEMTMSVYVNEALQGSVIGNGTGGIGLPAHMSMVTEDGPFYWGEALVANEDTRGWRIHQLKPTSFGVNKEWEGSPSAVTDGSLLTGISTDEPDARASFGVTNTDSIPKGSTVERVCIQTYAQRGDSGLSALNHFFRYGDGTVADGEDIPLAPVAEVYLDEYPTKPDTALPWEVSDIKGLQIGVRSRN